MSHTISFRLNDPVVVYRGTPERQSLVASALRPGHILQISEHFFAKVNEVWHDSQHVNVETVCQVKYQASDLAEQFARLSMN